MRQVTINLSDEVFHYLSIRAAIDDLRVPEAVEQFLTELATAKMERREISFMEG